MTRSTARIGLLVAASMAIGSLLYLWYGPTAVRQRRWMGMAREHVPVVEALLFAGEGFEAMRVGVGTGGGGTLLVVGSVATQDDLQRLRTVVAGSKPPVETVFAVRVE